VCADISDSPPEPAPPEVPPRGPSLHHAGHATLRGLQRGTGSGSYIGSPESPAAGLLGENESEMSAGYHTATPSAINNFFLSQGKTFPAHTHCMVNNAWHCTVVIDLCRVTKMEEKY
jgi:hypothetical protein